MEVPEIPAVSGRIFTFDIIQKLPFTYPRILTHVLQAEFKFYRNKKKCGLAKGNFPGIGN